MVRIAKVRIDQLLLDRQIAKNIEEAKALIMAGQILVNDQKVDKAGTKVSPDVLVRLLNSHKSRFVSRGGDKLLGAIIDFDLRDRIKGATVLDIGASTGGFTDCCLELGAQRVIALDVGLAQLAWKLRNDPRVICLERTDIRDFKSENFPEIDIVVGDISFNSLSRLCEYILRAANRKGVLWLLLIKPQFELPRHLIPTGGVIDDENLIESANLQVINSLNRIGVKELGIRKSKLKGAKGNQECFILASVDGQ